MPLFEQHAGRLVLAEQSNFALEKDLQLLIEQNLETVFSCRFVATEFSTGAQHQGRIDTLGLSEDDNPVIVEYKKVESSELINQSLYYLNWIADHRGDFELAAQRTLGQAVNVDWSDVRVICLAPNYKKYDLHAVQVMQANIELWRYRLFSNGVLYIEEVFRPELGGGPTDSATGKNPVMVAAGKKAAVTRRTASYTVESHLNGKSESIQRWFRSLQDYSIDLDDKVDEVPKKGYVAYKAAKNFACFEIQQKKILGFLKLEPADFEGESPAKYRDVTHIGHFATGNAEVTIESDEDVEAVKPFIERSFQRVGGA